MQATPRLLIVLAALLLPLACSPAGGPPPAGAPAGPPAAPVGSQLTAAEKAAIGRKIWQNESAGTLSGLTAWNAGEEFPSLGIGHFIWYPAGQRGPYVESFPEFVRFARARGAQLPALANSPAAPWPNRAAFTAELNSPRMQELRSWLANNLTVQTDFIIARSQAALPALLAAAAPAERARIQANYQKVAATPNGTYALIDYVNFKGDGISPAERYNGRGWGLLQVLEGMREVPAGQPAAAEFAASAIRVLDRRIANASPNRPETQWRAGWHNRAATYARPL
jgi:hypothetical protein